MENLADFARRGILEVTRERAPMPRPAGCRLVTGLSPAGLAAAAGIAIRDFLVEMNGEAAAELLDLESYGPGPRSYTFYARARHERVVVRTTGLDPGMELAPTPEAIRASYDPRQPRFEALLELWRSRDWANTARLAEATLQAQRSRATPALALLAAALVESGRVEEGGRLAEEYLRDHARKWTMDFTAVALHAQGVAAAARGDRDAAVGLWETAWDHEPLERTAQALEKATGRRPPTAVPPWPGRRFPIDYRLPLLESAQPGQASLGDALSATPEGALFVVCLLCNYRVNGPYARFLFRWSAWAPHFAGRLAGLHVITEQAERPAGRESLFQVESEARAAGLPMTLLLDATGAVSAAVEPPSSPNVLALDREGRVEHQGLLDGVELWNALAGLEQRA